MIPRSISPRPSARWPNTPPSHPHNLAQKAEVMIEHYRAHTRHKIGGRGKAMVVTRSRLHAVRYKKAFEDVIAAKGYTGLGVLVAFSGTVNDDGDEVTRGRHEWLRRGRASRPLRVQGLPHPDRGPRSIRRASTSHSSIRCSWTQEAERPQGRPDTLAA